MKGSAATAVAPPVSAGLRGRFSIGRIVRIGLAVVLLAAGIAIYGPQLLFTTSSEAVLNARLVTIAAPIEGQITGTLPAEGSMVAGDSPLLTIENPIVDRSRLEDLEASRTRVEAELDAAKRLVADLTAQIAGLEEQTKAYLAATVTRLTLAEKEARADAAAAAANAVDAQHNYERKQALNSGTTISVADIDHARQAALNAAAVAERTGFTAQRLGEELDAAKRGILVAADRNDVPYSQQRLDEFRIRKAEAAAQATVLAARLAELDRQVLKERTRAALLAVTEVKAPAGGVIWRPLVSTGSTVARHSELLTLIDCSQIYATAAFSARQFDDLQPGRRAVVHVLGTNDEFPATVVDTRAMQQSTTADRFAAPLPKLNDRQVLTILRLDDPRPLAARKYCDIGRRIEVRFPDRPGFGLASFGL